MEVAKIVLIKVTLDDIKNGKPTIADQCPISIACRRIFPTANFIRITPLNLVYSFKSVKYGLIPLTLPVVKKIAEYDATGKMTPFEFEIDWSKSKYIE